MSATHRLFAAVLLLCAAPASSYSLAARHLLPRTAIACRSSPLCMAVAVDAKTVKSLRDATGAGMMDCKKALVENDGDVQKAADYLRKKGIASADKKAGRGTGEGIIETY